MTGTLKDFRTRDHEDGFTLIELMIVMVIIGILAAIAIPIFMNQQKAAINASVKSDVKNTATDLASILPQNPTATDVAALVGLTSGEGVTLATAPTRIPISDDATVMTITGDWTNYTVRGENPKSESCYLFNSATGKLTECEPTSGTTPEAGGEDGPDENGKFTLPQALKLLSEYAVKCDLEDVNNYSYSSCPEYGALRATIDNSVIDGGRLLGEHTNIGDEERVMYGDYTYSHGQVIIVPPNSICEEGVADGATTGIVYCNGVLTPYSPDPWA